MIKFSSRLFSLFVLSTSFLFLLISNLFAGSPTKVGFVYLHTKEDFGWTMAHERGAQMVKKHFGKFYALKKAIILLFKLVSKYLRAVLFFKNKDRKLIYAELHGLICSVLNKSSYYRPYKNIHLQ